MSAEQTEDNLLLVRKNRPDPINIESLSPEHSFSDIEFLNVNDLRPRANTAPPTPSRPAPISLVCDIPQIKVEDFSTLQSPTANCNPIISGSLGSLGPNRPKSLHGCIPTQSRPRSRTCPEDLFRKTYKRPPTPPPISSSKLLEFGKSQKPRFSALQKGFAYNKDVHNSFILKELPENALDHNESNEKDNNESVTGDFHTDTKDISNISVDDIYSSESIHLDFDQTEQPYTLNRRGSS
ncbi:hypothetical protein Ahia01_000555200 [Argonauta hians]